MRIRNVATVSAVLLLSTSLGVAGDTKSSEAVTGKVVSYEPNHKIVIDTGSNQTAEVKVTKDTALQDKSGKRTSALDIQRGATVKVQVKGGEAASIRSVADVAGPDFKPTPQK